MAKKKDDEILKLALERFEEIESYEGEQREKMRLDKLFGLGDQWDPNDRKSREDGGRFCLTVQRSNQFTDHIKNQNRQIAPSIKISPTDDGDNEKVAERRQGLIRHIQYDSKSVMARNQAFDDAVDMGRGHYIVKTEWDGPESIDKKIIVEPIQDPFTVYMDINREKPDYSDCKFGFIVNTQRRKEFREEYPDAVSSTWTGHSSHKWSTVDRVTWAEYYCLKIVKRTLLAIKGYGEDGEEDVKLVYKDELKRELHPHEEIVKKREVEDAEWWWYKITSQEILDREKLPFKFIPIITNIGKETTVDGQLILKGLLRDIRDPLTLYNWVASTEGEIIAKATAVQWLFAEGQDEGYEDMWARSNVSNDYGLMYKPTSFEGQLVPPPQKIQFAGVPQGLVNQRHEIIEDCKAITGIYDASIGNRSNETSGVAIRARQAQGENANYHYTQNSIYGVTHEGRVINSALPTVYDTPRTLTIMGEDDNEDVLRILQDPEDPGLGTGSFNVTVAEGPNSDTARQEQASGTLQMLEKVGIVQEVAADIAIRMQDWKGKNELADRVEFGIEQKYPGITKQVKSDGENDEVVVLQQQLQQAQSQMQQMGQQAQQLQEALQKSNADKNAADKGKVQNDMEELKQGWEKLKIEKGKIEGELALKRQELELTGKIKDLEVSSNVEISSEKNKTEIIKTEMSKQQQPEVKPEAPKEKSEKPPAINIYNGGTKVSTVKKTSDNSYEVVTKTGDK